MRDFSTYAFHVTRDGDDFEVRQAADGRPKYSELLAVRAYREVFPLSTNIYHPHEAAADLFAQLVLFDSHLAPRMERAPREEKEKTFGPLRRWFRKILGDDPSNAKAGQRMDPMPDFARLWGGLPTCPACSRLETCSTKRLDFKISRTDWPGSPAAPLKTRRRT
jgi:hypothetical protein